MSSISVLLEMAGRKVTKIVPLYNSNKVIVGEVIYLVPVKDDFFVGYCRVSTPKQGTNNSLITQSEYVDTAEIIIWEIGSGYNNNRPGFEKLKRIINSKGRGALVTRFLSRLTRCRKTACELCKQIIETDWVFITSEFFFNYAFDSEQSRHYNHELLATMIKLDDNAVARQGGIDKRKQIKGSYPGRQPLINEALYKKYLLLKEKHPKNSNKMCYVALKISKSTFHRMILKFEKKGNNM